MIMSLFTCIFDYKGGTYIKQVEAETVKDATIAWAGQIQKQKFGDDKRSLPSSVEEDLKDNWPVALKGMKNAWCTTLFSGRDFALLNIVKTVGVGVDSPE
jgi:hypothetical protein